MRGIRWILVAIALVCPALARASAAQQLLLVPLAAPAVEAAVAAEVGAHLESEARVLLPLVEPGATRCPTVERSCLVAAGVAAGADVVLHASLRPVGENLVLLLVRVGVEDESIARLSEPLPRGEALRHAVRERLVRLLAPARWVGELLVEATPGSEIWLDGERRGIAPEATHFRDLAPGQHLLRVARTGLGEARAYVEIHFDRQTQVRVEPRSDELAVVGTAELPAAPEPAPGDGQGVWQPLRWSLLGAGGAAIALAAWPALDARSIRSEREALRAGSGAFPAGAAREQRLLQERYERRQIATSALLGSGVLLVAGGAALFWLAPSGSDEGGVSVRAGPDGFSMAGRF
ncbi:hypothetical protein [Vulgatibacter sp.]|uniref:hypothetical protein n=1 Tax=Vulgatibacter sp. TaxID=1971226 RepID=UPI0035680459